MRGGKKKVKDLMFMGYYESPKPYKKVMLCNLACGFFIVLIWIRLNGGLLPQFLLSYGVDESRKQSLLVDHFPQTREDGSMVTWAHGTNTREALMTAIKDDRMMMLEGEVVLRGQNTPKQELVPVMFRANEKGEELIFEDWLSIVIDSQKGFKLDFKTIEPVELCLQKLASRKARIEKPVLLGANILPTQHNADPEFGPVDAQRFLRLTTQYMPEATLVLGWTLDPKQMFRYDWSMVLQMYNLLASKNIKQPVSINVHATLSRESIAPLKWLVELMHLTVTVTSSPTDEVNPNDFLFLRNKFPKQIVYYDMHHSHAVDKESEKAEMLASHLQTLQNIRFRTEGWRLLQKGYGEKVYVTSEAIVIQKGLLLYTEDPYVFTNEPMIIRGRVTMFDMPKDKDARQDLGITISLHETTSMEINSIQGIRCFFGVDGFVQLSAILQHGTDTMPIMQQLDSGIESGCFTFELKEIADVKVIVKVVYALDCNSMSYFNDYPSSTHTLELDIKDLTFSIKEKYVALSSNNPYGYVAIDVLRIN